MGAGVRQALKAAAERGLIWSGAAALHRLRMRGRVLVLAYHNVVPDNTPLTGDLANHVPLSVFAAQLAELRRTHDVVPLAETLEIRRGGRPRAAITFDDAYRGAVVHGVAELVRQGLPATIFVAPGLLGSGSFWWDALAQSGTGLDAGLRVRALGELRGEDAAIRRWAAAAGVQAGAVHDVAHVATEAELLHAASSPGIALGSHSWAHPNLTLLNADELALELTRSLTWLRDRLANPLRWIAYPYGLADDSVKAAAVAAGYEAALGIRGGWFPRGSADRFSLPRINIPPGLSGRGFALRGAGFLGD